MCEWCEWFDDWMVCGLMNGLGVVCDGVELMVEGWVCDEWCGIVDDVLWVWVCVGGGGVWVCVSGGDECVMVGCVGGWEFVDGEWRDDVVVSVVCVGEDVDDVVCGGVGLVCVMWWGV